MNYPGVRMGEKWLIGGSRDYCGVCTLSGIHNYSPSASIIHRLAIIRIDKLKYIFNNAVYHNKCKITSISQEISNQSCMGEKNVC